MVYYSHHTLRSGGKGKPSVLKAIFEWQWQVLYHRVTRGPQDVVDAFHGFVDERMEQLDKRNNDTAGVNDLQDYIQDPHLPCKAKHSSLQVG